MVLKSVGVVSAGKISGLLYGGMGLIVGFFFTVFALVGAGMGAMAEQDMGAVFAMFMGVGAIVAFPIFYGVMGFVCGVIGAALYNLVAGWVGGIELSLE
jgi:hypothetical protein